MREKLLKFIRSEGGFSLVEAIVTIVIVGVAMVPISVVFSQTVNTTRTTRRQLDANELAQAYIEDVKGKDFDAFFDIFTGGGSSITLDSSDTAGFQASGLEVIEDGFRLNLRYETATDLPEYQAPADVSIGPVDAVIEIPSDDHVTDYDSDPVYDTREVYFYRSDGSEITNTGVRTLTGTTRIIHVKLTRGSSNYEVSYKNGSGSESITATNMSYGTAPALRVNVGDLGQSGAGIGYETTLQIESNLTEEVKVYVFESDESPVNLQTETLSGYVSFSRNLTTGSSSTRIVDVYVEIVDESTNETLIELITTKVEE